jgi:hypothetical protein
LFLFAILEIINLVVQNENLSFKLFATSFNEVITQDLDIGSDASLLIIIFLKNRKII